MAAAKVPKITINSGGHITAVVEETVTVESDMPASPTRGDIIIANSVPAWAKYAIGSTKNYLRSNGTDPAWSALLIGDFPTGGTWTLSTDLTLSGANLVLGSRLVGGTTLATVSTTGTLDDLNFSGADLLRMTNASDATIRGLVAGYPGQRVTIAALGAGNVYLAHENVGSTAANRLVNFATGGNTPLAAGCGTATYQYDATTARWRLIAHEQGKPISVAYDAANFTASTGTWTVDAGDQVTFAYYLKGRRLTVDLFVGDTDVSATPSFLWVTLPNGYVANVTLRSVAILVDAGASAQAGQLTSSATEGKLYFFKFTGAWTATALDNTACYGSITFEIT